MAAILRIDVDNPYWRFDFQGKVMSHLRYNYWFTASRTLGYLKFAQELLDDLNQCGIQANWYFLPQTIPYPELIEQLKDGEHEIGLHAARTREQHEFREDVHALSSAIKRDVSSFTKHGHGWGGVAFIGHEPEYNPEKLLEFAHRIGLSIFLGNGLDFEQPVHKEFGITYYPSAYVLNKEFTRINREKLNLDWFVEKCSSHDMVLLVHPLEWASPNKSQVAEDLDYLIDKIDEFKVVST